MTTELPQNTEGNKPTNKVEIAVAVVVLICVLAVGFYVMDTMKTELENHPDANTLGPPRIQTIGIIAIIVLLSVLILLLTYSYP